MNEKAGRTGFAHLFEHLMFQGSQHHDDEYFGPLERIGADLNGTTGQDHTNYYETVPSNALELALWLESDRMGFLVPALTQEKLDNQRDVVKNERRQSYDNQPYGQAHEALLEALYPAGHPYHHSTIGSMADLSAARLRDVAAFFRTYYNPNNASLCIAGDFDPAETKRLVAKYFGPIPAGPQVDPGRAERAEARRAEACDRCTTTSRSPGSSWSGRRCHGAIGTSRRSTSWRRYSAGSIRRTGSSGRSCTIAGSRPRSRPATRRACCRASSRS